MLKPHELFIGAVLNYDTAEGHEMPIIVNAKTLEWIEQCAEQFNLVHTPIQLTPEILTDWCGWKVVYSSKRKLRIEPPKNYFILFEKETFIVGEVQSVIYYGKSIDKIQYLHQLQALYALLTGEVMAINLPKE